MAGNLIMLRAAGPLTTQDVQQTMGPGYLIAQPYIDIEDSSFYTVKALGFSNDHKKGYPIKAIVAMDSSKTLKIIYYKSPAYDRHE